MVLWTQQCCTGFYRRKDQSRRHTYMYVGKGFALLVADRVSCKNERYNEIYNFQIFTLLKDTSVIALVFFARAVMPMLP
jgi:hypothetical protein